MRTTKLIVTAMLAAAMCSGQAWGATIESAVSGYWTNGATWVGGTPPGSGDEAVITNGCTVTNTGLSAQTVSNLTIQAGGVLTHTANTSTEAHKLILNIVSNLTIEAGGAVDVDGKGYSSFGPGVGTRTGGYGGEGGYINTETPGKTYGSITSPTNCGSNSTDGSRGGGAAILNVRGVTTLNGRITARAANIGGQQGSGGSVFLTTGTLTGSGTIDAGVLSGAVTCSGGGGRIAVILTNGTDFGSITMRAFTISGSWEEGSPGTIYKQTKDQESGKGTLVIDTGNIMAGALSSTLQKGDGPSSYEFSEIVLTNGARYALDANDTLIVTNTVVRGSPVDRKEGFDVYGGTLTIPSALVFSNYYIRIATSTAPFDPSSVTVGANADLRIDQPFTLNCPLTVQAGGVLAHSDNANTEAYKLDLTLNGALDIQAGGAIDVDGLGYGSAGPGAGGGAGGYGGVGGYWAGSGTYTPGTTYGSVTAPTNCGSGSTQGGAGGGAVIMRVRDGITLNGSITARAANSGYQGSGGSVFLTTSTLTGSGTIDAGVLGSSLTCPGGGGRIAVILTNDTGFGSITMRAFTTSGSQQEGSPGTIYRQTKDQAAGRGTLLIDAGNIVAGTESSTLIGPLVTNATVGTVIVTNQAKLAISNQTLTVQGDWIIAPGASFSAQTNSTADFAGMNTATIYTNNTFYNLTCTNAGKTLAFQAGRTNTVNGLLKLGVTGPVPPVTLQSTVPGSWAYLTLVSGGTQQITRVSVKDNNASGGQLLVAGGGSANGGNNINWQFPPSGTMFMVK